MEYGIFRERVIGDTEIDLTNTVFIGKAPFPYQLDKVNNHALLPNFYFQTIEEDEFEESQVTGNESKKKKNNNNNFILC